MYKKNSRISFQFNLNIKNVHLNLLSKIKSETSNDAENLRKLCFEASQKFEDFFARFKVSNQSKLEAIFFSTPSMRRKNEKYKNLLIIDTTFGTNRFRMPMMIGAVVNNEGRTVIVFVALIQGETTADFE